MATKKLNRHAREFRSERFNLSLTKGERRKLEEIAAKEDRDMSYIAAWMIRWAIDMYDQFGGTSIVNLVDMELYLMDHNKAEAHFYLNRLKQELQAQQQRIAAKKNGNAVTESETSHHQKTAQ